MAKVWGDAGASISPLAVGKSFERMQGQPLDASAIFTNENFDTAYAKAAEFAASDNAYVGMMLSVSNGTTTKFYGVINEAGTLKELGEDLLELTTDISAAGQGKAADAKAVSDRIDKLSTDIVSGMVVVDDTLTQTGKAADAAKVGSELSRIEGKIPQEVSSGTGDGSTVIGDGQATGKYSFAGGTTDSSLVKEIAGVDIGILTDDLVEEALGERGPRLKDNLESNPESQASGASSWAFGTGNNSITAMSNTFGAGNEAGSKGFYLHKITVPEDGGEITIDLSVTQKPYYRYQQMKYVVAGDLVWKEGNTNTRSWTDAAKTALNGKWVVGDSVNIILKKPYCLVEKITYIDPDNGIIRVTNSGQITASKVASDIEYKGAEGVVEAPIKLAALVPYQFTVSVPAKPDIGIAEIHFAATATGLGSIAAGTLAYAHGAMNLAAGPFSFVVGQNNIVGYSAFASGQDNLAIGYNSHAEGINTVAKGSATHAEGSGTTAIGDYAHAEGNSVKKFSVYTELATAGITDIHDKWLTLDSASEKFALAYGNYSHIEGQNCLAFGARAHAEGWMAVARGGASHAEGRETLAQGTQSHAEGYLTLAKGSYSHAQGYRTVAYGKSSHAEGGTDNLCDTSKSQSELIAEFDVGRNAVSDDGSLGYWGVSYGEYAHSEGLNTFAAGYASHAEGRRTLASGEASHAEGALTSAKGLSSHAEGEMTVAVGRCAHAEGAASFTYAQQFSTVSDIVQDFISAKTEASYAGYVWSVAFGVASHVEGYENLAAGLAAHSEGMWNIASGEASHAEGYDVTASGDRSHAEGVSTEATNIASHAEGYKSHATGTYSHAEGSNTHATKQSAHAEGRNTHATGISAHAEGSYTLAAGENSYASGSYSEAHGVGAHAEGRYTYAKGSGAHAEGSSCVTTGLAQYIKSGAVNAESTDTILEGWRNLEAATRFLAALGDHSHAEGQGTLAVGMRAHAEGFITVAKASGSHAEGWATEALGTSSHSEGQGTKAVYAYSHAEGYYTETNAKYQHVQGYYNDTPNDGNTYLHIVGNGSKSKRSNAHTLTDKGDAWFAGVVTSGTSKAPHRGILIGTNEPTDDIGVDGDIYIMYEM